MALRYRLGVELDAVPQCQLFCNRCCKGSRFLRGPLTSQSLASPGLLGVALLNYLAVSLVSRLKDCPLREADDTVNTLQECGIKNPYMYTYPISHFIWVGMSTNAVGIPLCVGVSRPKQFHTFRAGCSLHAHVFTLRVYCPLCLPLTRVSSS